MSQFSVKKKLKTHFQTIRYARILHNQSWKVENKKGERERLI